MSFQVESCFGVDLNAGFFDLGEIIELLGIKNDVLKHKRIRSLVGSHGKKSRIVSIAMRQIILDEVKVALESELLPYDANFQFEALLSTTRERLYDAQERFLLLCFSVAQGKSIRSLRKLHPTLTSKDWRDKANKKQSLFRYFRQELDNNTREYILSYKAKQKASTTPDVAVGVETQNTTEQPSSSKTPQSSSKTPQSNSKTPQSSSKTSQSNASVSNKKLVTTSFNDEVVTALKLFEEGHFLLVSQVERFKSGDNLDLEKLKRFCQRLIASHSRNPFALLAIRHIKDASMYLEQHAMGVAVLAIHFATSLSLPEPYVQAMALGGLLFDLGRFRLPMALSAKTTKMTDGEFDLFRKHITFGEQILKRCDDLPKVVYQMLEDHHERIDGAGYPRGKQGEEISVYGKITGIIDAYDSLTSDQAHKRSMGPLKARQQLIKEVGLAFDKPLLGVFLKNIGRVPVGSCIALSNGRVGFVLTLSVTLEPALIRQVYSLTNKSFIAVSDIDLSKPGYSEDSAKIVKEIDPQSLGIQFSSYLS